MEKYRYLFIKAATLLLPVFFVMITCSAAATLPESGLLWKNISVMGKRMSVYCIFTDSRGIVWLGTNNGLFFYDGVTTHAVDESGKAMNQVYSITEKDGKLFLGTNYGLMTFSFQDNSIGYYTADSPKEIRCMLIDDDRIWLGSIYGMYTVDTGTKEIMDISEGLPHKSVYSILKDCRGILYAGTYDGLSRWDQAENVFREVPIPEHDCNSGNLFVNCLLETADRQKICIGTEGNMYMSYGSFSGGIYCIELDPETGLRKDGKTSSDLAGYDDKAGRYGTCLAANRNTEGSVITYHEDVEISSYDGTGEYTPGETKDLYYMMSSSDSLSTTYNMRGYSSATATGTYGATTGGSSTGTRVSGSFSWRTSATDNAINFDFYAPGHNDMIRTSTGTRTAERFCTTSRTSRSVSSSIVGALETTLASTVQLPRSSLATTRTTASPGHTDPPE